MSKKKTLNEVITSFKDKHGDKFDYAFVKYVNIDTNVDIVCRACSMLFSQTPYKHINAKNACPNCRSVAQSVAMTQDLESFKEKVFKRFGDVYDYTDSVYIGCKDYITVKCKTCDETLTSSPNNHLHRVNSCPCQQTAAMGFQEYLPAMLYYIKVVYKGNTAYKIGITNKDVNTRFKSNTKGNISIIKTWDYIKGRDARIEESRILKDFNVYKWNGIDLLTDGNTELFSRDILELDRNII